MSHANHLELLKDLIRNRSHISVLDVGTELGQSALPLTEYFNRTVGVDISSEAIFTGRKLLRGQRKRLKLKVMDGAVLRFPAQTFDCVTSFWSLHHLRLLPRVLTEMHRVLRSSEIFFAVDHLDREGNALQNNYIDLHKLKIKIEKTLGKNHFDLILPEDMVRKLKAINFKDIGFELFLGQPVTTANRQEFTKKALDMANQLRNTINLLGAIKRAEFEKRLDQIQNRILTIGVEPAPYYAVYGFTPSEI